MSSVTFTSVASQSSVKQGLLNSEWLANPSGVLNRRGRLARTLVVLSLSVVMVAGFAARSGAGDHPSAAISYVMVVVPSGATLWSLASTFSNGDTQGLIEQIREVNNLKGYDLAAGARLRIPVK